MYLSSISKIKSWLFVALGIKFCIMLLLALMTLLSSCSPLTPYAMNDIKHDMNKRDVVAYLGKPYSVKTVRDVEFLTYYVHQDVSDFFFTNHFPYILPYPFVRTGSEYWVILEQNKVIGVGNAIQDFGWRKNHKGLLFINFDNITSNAKIVDTQKIMTNKMMCGNLSGCEGEDGQADSKEIKTENITEKNNESSYYKRIIDGYQEVSPESDMEVKEL